jgi:hypothetical protein
MLTPQSRSSNQVNFAVPMQSCACFGQTPRNEPFTAVKKFDLLSVAGRNDLERRREPRSLSPDPARAIVGRACWVTLMRPPLIRPPKLRDFVLVAFWLGMKIAVGLVIGAALFETVGLIVGLINRAKGG